jgi:ATP-dependent protease Clp ATPase subunit
MRCSFCGNTEYQTIFENKEISDKRICDKCARLCRKLTKMSNNRSTHKIISFPTVDTIA